MIWLYIIQGFFLWLMLCIIVLAIFWIGVFVGIARQGAMPGVEDLQPPAANERAEQGRWACLNPKEMP